MGKDTMEKVKTIFAPLNVWIRWSHPEELLKYIYIGDALDTNKINLGDETQSIRGSYKMVVYFTGDYDSGLNGLAGCNGCLCLSDYSDKPGDPPNQKHAVVRKMNSIDA